MKKGLLFLSVIVMCLFITACKKNMIGNYEMIQMNNGENVITQYDLKSYGISFELVVNEGGKATLKEGNTTTSLTYDEEKFIGIDPETDEKREINYTFDGTQLVLEELGDKMVFQKKK